MKIIAYYLPQFHAVEQNDIWWGKNFTEWVNTKKMKPLFNGHYQPREPLDDNYYNLLDKKVIEWQSKIAKDYNIYGFCYYHYWFSGYKILEKPAENLLKWGDIEQNFCFCWANHDWKKNVNGKAEILKKQTYGNEEEWEEHFLYLIDFFKDERYIKIENKPVFVLYDTSKIERYNERISFYNRRCKDYGFEGIYVIESINSISGKKASYESQAIVLREPVISMSSIGIIERLKNIVKRRIIKIPVKYNYEKIFKRIINLYSSINSDEKVYPGTFIDWDNTPRHGNGGSLMKYKTPEIFAKYLNIQRDMMSERGIEFIFMNAWNEWAEGMYLEPDKKNAFTYLEAIKKVNE